MHNCRNRNPGPPSPEGTPALDTPAKYPGPPKCCVRPCNGRACQHGQRHTRTATHTRAHKRRSQAPTHRRTARGVQQGRGAGTWRRSPRTPHRRALRPHPPSPARIAPFCSPARAPAALAALAGARMAGGGSGCHLKPARAVATAGLWAWRGAGRRPGGMTPL